MRLHDLQITAGSAMAEDREPLRDRYDRLQSILNRNNNATITQQQTKQVDDIPGETAEERLDELERRLATPVEVSEDEQLQQQMALANMGIMVEIQNG